MWRPGGTACSCWCRIREQFPAIQAAAMDPRLKKSMEKDRYSREGWTLILDSIINVNSCGHKTVFLLLCVVKFIFFPHRVSDEDFRKAELFVEVMRILCTSTLWISSPTLGQIIPILWKDGNGKGGKSTTSPLGSSFTQTIKDKIWVDISKAYQVYHNPIEFSVYSEVYSEKGLVLYYAFVSQDESIRQFPPTVPPTLWTLCQYFHSGQPGISVCKHYPHVCTVSTARDTIS